MTEHEFEQLINKPELLSSEKAEQLFLEQKKTIRNEDFKWFAILCVLMIIFIGWHYTTKNEIKCNHDNATYPVCQNSAPNYDGIIKLASDSTFDFLKAHPDSLNGGWRYLYDNK